MRSWLAATLMFMASAVSPLAQRVAPSNAGPRPKAAATVPVHSPGLQTPTDTANAVAQGERLALQSDLAWVGEYNGAITGDVSERMVAAIKEYQKIRGAKPTGVLNPQERAGLAATARRRQENVGWRIVTDAGTVKKFYIRGTFKDDEVRFITILYDQAVENTVEPVVIAISSAFNPFPTETVGPAPRKSVEYSTGLIVTEDGAILADREATDGCQGVLIQGVGRAELVGDDKERGLALLHIYGVSDLKPLNLAGGAAKAGVEIVGIADPQNQDGGAAVTATRVQVTGVGTGGDLALSPAPAIGFCGAPALDEGGKFAGIAVLKPVQVATTGATGAAPQSQPVLVTPDHVREFLKRNDVGTDGKSTDAKAAVVRVICVRR